MSATAIRIMPIWDDPAGVVELIRSAGPFWPLANYAASDAEMEALGRKRASSFTPPWFRQDFAREGEVLVPGVEAILGNERFADAAMELGGGGNTVVRPQAVYVKSWARPRSGSHRTSTYRRFEGLHGQPSPYGCSRR